MNNAVINQANQVAVNPAEETERPVVGGGGHRQPSNEIVGTLGPVSVAVAPANHAPARAEQEEGSNRIFSFRDRITLAANEAGTVAHTLWNSIPPFLVAGDRERYTDIRETWVGHRTNPYFVELGLTSQVEAVIRACDALIALPAYGYHLTAQQRYDEFQTATSNFRNAEQAALAARHAAQNAVLDTADQTATVLTPIPGSKERAYYAVAPFGTGQAHDARRGLAGTIPEPANAIPIAEEIPDEATIDPNLPHAEAEDATPMDPEHQNADLAPVAGAEAHVENSTYIPPENLG